MSGIRILLAVFAVIGLALFPGCDTLNGMLPGGSAESKPITDVLAINPAATTIYIGTNATFTAAGGTSPYTFSLQTGAGSFSASTAIYAAPIFSESAKVRVTDAIGNIAESLVTVNGPVTISPSTKTVAVNNVFTFSPIQGMPPFGYSVVAGDGTIDPSSGAYTAPAAPGSATVRVTDSKGNTSDAEITINPELAISPTDTTIAAGNSATFSGNDGVPPYRFFVASGGGSVSSSGVYTAGAAAGTAVVGVIDAMNNDKYATVTVNAALAISPSSKTVAVNNAISFSATGGVGAYTYSIAAGGGAIDPITGAYTAPANAGSATVRVTDSLGNTSNATVTINAALAISPAAKTLAVNNSATFSATGGVGPYTYSIAAGGGTINASTGVYTSPANAGSTTVRVTDSLGNTSNASVTINAALAITPASKTLAINNVFTFGTTGGVAPFTYAVTSGTGSINSGSGEYTAPNAVGTATVRVTDSLGNTSSASVTINPALAISPTSYTLAVNNSTTFSATGGVGAYTYSVAAGGGSINPATGVYTAPGASGSATVRVTDSIGNTSDAAVTINAALAISPASKTLAVNYDFTFTATGGVSPYTYSVAAGGGSIDPTSGEYTAPAGDGSAVVRVTDSLGNTSDSNVTINAALAIVPTTKTLAINNEFTFTATGGAGTFTYSVFAGTGTINPATGAYTAPAAPGVATVRVTDSFGGTSDCAVTINAALSIAPASITLAVNNATTFSATGGTGGNTYSVAAGGGNIDPNTGLYTAPGADGSATIRVTDSFGNTSDSTVTINAALAISPGTKTLAVNNTTTFSATGGVAPYSYAVVAGTGSVVAGTGEYTAPANSGTATVRVTDSLGNTSNASVTINAALAISPANKILAVNNIFTFSATGGVAPYSYAVVAGTGSVVAGTGEYTAPANSGTATVRVTDSLGNTSNASVTINSALAISPAAKTLAVNNVFTFSATGGVGPYSYAVIAGTGSVVAGTGEYTAPANSDTATVRVTDTLGNTSDATVTINSALAISPTTKTLAVNNVFTFSATGGVGAYTYSVFAGSGNIDDQTGEYTAAAAPGSATVRVTDTLGNTSDSTVTINAALAISPSSITLAVNNTTTFTATGGVAPYSYAVVAGTGSVVAGTGEYTAPAGSGTATVRVTDSFGNTSNASVTINSALAISPSSITLAVNNMTTFSATGGVGPYSYAVTAGTGSVSPITGDYTAPASPGSATVRVTDSRGNTSNASVTVNAALAISPGTKTLAVNNVFTFTASGGVGAYTYSIFAGDGSIDDQTGEYTAAATPGSATVRVTDSLGNTSTSSVTINAALAITPTTKTLAVNNVFTFTASGGTGGYTYSVFAGDGSIDDQTGEYTAAATLGSATVRVTDSFGNTSDSAVTINNALAITPTSKTLAVGNSTTFGASGGVGAYTYSVFSGGGSIDPDTGLYTAPGGSGSATVRVTDSLGNTSNATVTINAALAISPAAATININGTLTFSATGGVTSYSYSVVAGPGSIVPASGVYTAPSTIGSATIRVTDSLGNTSNASLTIVRPTSIAAGGSHTCALFNDGSVKCWGYNFYGQLGLGDTDERGSASSEMGSNLSRVALGTERTATAIAAGANHTCALLDDDTVKCWGLNTSGQLGRGNTDHRGGAAGQMGDNLAAIDLGSGRTATAIAAGGDHTCAVLDDGSVKCWGLNDFGQLGQGDTDPHGSGASQMGDDLPAIDLGTNRTALALSLGNKHSCARLDDNSIKCWGYNATGQLGQGDTTNYGSASNQMGDDLLGIDLGTGLSSLAIGAGGSHVCTRLNNSSIKCWGYNFYGQLGLGDVTERGSASSQMGDFLAAVGLGAGRTATALSTGSNHSCALLDNATVKCWGYNNSGQLGQGDTNPRGSGSNQMGDNLSAISLGTGRTVLSIASGFGHNCALLDNYTVKCWGDNLNGQLGLGDATNRGTNASQLGDNLSALNL